MGKVRIQDDLFMAVNGEWLEKAVIPGDRPATGSFFEIDENVEKRLMNDFAKIKNKEEKSDIKEMQEAVKLYKKFLDADRRNAEGIKPALKVLDKIKGLKTVEDLNKVSKEFLLSNIDLPIMGFVENDMTDATRHSFNIMGPSIILPDTTYYDEANPAYPQLIGLYSGMASQILAQAPLTEEEQKEYLADTLEFDKLVSKAVKSRVEWSNYVNNNNPLDIDEAQKYLAPFDLKGLLNDLYGDKAPKIVVAYDLRAIKEFNTYFNEGTFTKYVHWCYVKGLLKACNFLSLELATLANTYERALMGVACEPPLDKKAYQMASQIFSEPVGVYYGRKYFGEEAKKDVVSLVKKIIETYKLRVKNNTFLQAETKEKAIKKLSTVEIKMGYPDEIDKFYSKMIVNEEDSLFDTIISLGKLQMAHNLEKLTKPVDRGEWVMPGHMVNACYNPSLNDITFPAAILQKPFYSIEQSISENLGGIGAVIAHEISHAFDTNGAYFDEKGNINNWWDPKDFEAFNNLAKGMVDQFDGIEIYGGKVNGQLVVSENVADNGGMAVTLEIMKTTPNRNYQEYFTNWGKIWAFKAHDEYYKLLLTNDVHSPCVLRANMTPRNFSEWYEAFGVTSSDKMYIPEDKRIVIW